MTTPGINSLTVPGKLVDSLITKVSDFAYLAIASTADSRDFNSGRPCKSIGVGTQIIIMSAARMHLGSLSILKPS